MTDVARVVGMDAGVLVYQLSAFASFGLEGKHDTQRQVLNLLLRDLTSLFFPKTFLLISFV